MTSDGAVGPAMEVGGSHVTAALVDLDLCEVVLGSRVRCRLDPHGSAGELLAAIAATADRVPVAEGARWGAAVPGPFDYDAGVARFRNVGKFDALDGTDVRAGLTSRMQRTPRAIVFVNDASAFALGEWQGGAATGHRRVVGITVGTGVGSAFLDGGVVVDAGPAVPPSGRADLLTIDGRPLEESVSARAILRRYAAVGGGHAEGVDAMAARASAGDAVARSSIQDAMTELGAALAPWLVRFGATVLVVGGSISAAWSLVEPGLVRGLAGAPALGDRCAVRRSADTEASALLGAAVHARTTS